MTVEVHCLFERAAEGGGDLICARPAEVDLLAEGAERGGAAAAELLDWPVEGGERLVVVVGGGGVA